MRNISLKPEFSRYLLERNKAGSGKATSYIRAINLVNQMIEIDSMGFGNLDVWRTEDFDTLINLQEVLQAAKSNYASSWYDESLPKSYLRDGFCSAAIKMYIQFLEEYQIEKSALASFEDVGGKTKAFSVETQLRVNASVDAIERFKGVEGKEELRTVKQRCNQNIFRKIILQVYDATCCITGLNIPELNIASHIIPWAEDEDLRLDPCNGLCLSATYDRAFDQNLISVDEDYRLIVSKDIKEYYTSEVVKGHFLSKEGEAIMLPASYKPSEKYLKKHRSRGRF